MIKNKLIGKIGCLLMLVWASVSLHAQSIELLGLYSNGSAGQLKAKVELAGKQILMLIGCPTVLLRQLRIMN